MLSSFSIGTSARRIATINHVAWRAKHIASAMFLAAYLWPALAPAAARAQGIPIPASSLSPAALNAEVNALAAELGITDTTKIELISYREFETRTIDGVVVTKIWTYRETRSRVTIARLRAGNASGILDAARDDLGASFDADRFLAELGDLTSREISGLGELDHAFSARESTGDLNDVLELPAASRNDLLALIGRISEQAEIRSGLAAAVARGFPLVERRGWRPEPQVYSVQGLLGQLEATAMLLTKLGAGPGSDPRAAVDFEVVESTPLGEREIDVVIRYGGRRYYVEVKTNLGDLLTIDRSQVCKDLVSHAGEGWNNLIYCLPAGQISNLPGARTAFLRAYDSLNGNPALLDQLARHPDLRDLDPSRRMQAGRELLKRRLDADLIQFFDGGLFPAN